MIMALHIFAIVRSITEISLDLDHVYQRDIASGLTVDYGEYFKLTFILTVVAAWCTDCSGMPPP